MRKISMTKGKAFVMCFCGIMFIFCIIALFSFINKKEEIAHVGAILTALCSISAGFIGFQVANNGVKGRFFEPALWDRENPKEEENPR